MSIEDAPARWAAFLVRLEPGHFRGLPGFLLAKTRSSRFTFSLPVQGG